MGASKLKTIHVVIIGCFACTVVIVGLYFLVIKKYNEQISILTAKYQAEEQQSLKKPQVEAQLEAARQEYRMVTWQYEKYLREKMPPLSFQDRAQGMIALWKEQAEVLGPMLQSWPAKTGVRLLSGVQVPAAVVNPNSIDVSLIRIPIGTFRVTGDFSAILSHIRSWNKFHRLVQIDPVSLTGPSPGMTAEYGLTVYIFPRGEAGPNITMAGAGEGGGGAGPAMPMAPAAAPQPSPGMPSGPINYQGVPGTPAPM